MWVWDKAFFLFFNLTFNNLFFYYLFNFTLNQRTKENSISFLISFHFSFFFHFYFFLSFSIKINRGLRNQVQTIAIWIVKRLFAVNHKRLRTAPDSFLDFYAVCKERSRYTVGPHDEGSWAIFQLSSPKPQSTAQSRPNPKSLLPLLSDGLVFYGLYVKTIPRLTSARWTGNSKCTNTLQFYYKFIVNLFLFSSILL